MTRWCRWRRASYPRSDRGLRIRLAACGRPSCTIGPIAAALSGAKDGPVSAGSVKAETPERESLAWVQALSGAGSDREEALERLHALLLRAARFELNRRRRLGTRKSALEVDDLAMQAADDALISVIRKLHTYRGESRFTTWAYKFA